MVSMLFISLGSAQFASFRSNNHHKELKLFNAENRALKNVKYRMKTVSSYVICGRDCSMEKECKSFNFYKCAKLCEFNNSTRLDQPEAFMEVQGAVYFDEDEETPLSSLPDDPANRNGSCKELKEAGYNMSGIFKIYPAGFQDGLDVYCDMETDGGGWIVFQRRIHDYSVIFDRNWTEYQSGFGNLSDEHWLGNDNLLHLTSDKSHGTWELRMDRTQEVFSFAKYANFTVAGENYTLDFGTYDNSSTAGDCLTRFRGNPFSTMDYDNDERSDLNCAKQYGFGWWFDTCSGIYNCASNNNRWLWRLYSCEIKIRETGQCSL